MLTPEFLSFEQFCLRHSIPDPGADHGMLGSSGHMSGRARRQFDARRDAQFKERNAGLLAYKHLMDQGVLVDPSGLYHAWTWEQEQHKRQDEAAILITQAQQLEQFAASGWKPIVHTRQAKLYRDKAAAILKGE